MNRAVPRGLLVNLNATKNCANNLRINNQGFDIITNVRVPLNFSDVSSDTVHWNPVYVVVLKAYMFFLASSMLQEIHERVKN